jgi:HAD superfamily hydrolase (TIGR01490 family)
VSGAAFFDLDRTLLSRSSSLALAGAFRRRGLIRRRQLAKAALAQILFARFGADKDVVRRTAERGMAVLAGVSVDEMQEIVDEAMEPVLKPLVYREALELARSHSAAGERTYIVSGALEQVVQSLARELDLDGALGSRCETVDGVYTGRLERALTALRRPRRSESWLRGRTSTSRPRPRTRTLTRTSRSSSGSADR